MNSRYIQTHFAVIGILIMLLSGACADDDDIRAEPTSDHLQYFGFTLIDTYWDDPTDGVAKTNYADEVNGFSNIADILVVNPTDDITGRVKYFDSLEMKALIHLHELFFETDGVNSPSGADYKLRTDYRERWEAFISLNQSVLTPGTIAAYYIGEEPTWNGITSSELEAAVNLLEETHPAIPTMIVEAYPALADLQVPENADWIGFDHYFIADPARNPGYLQELELLKSKFSSESQRLVVVMDTHYISFAHDGFGGISLDNMDEVAQSYYTLAKRETQTVALIGYFWPNGFDHSSAIGARSMPDHVKETYYRMGQEITGK
ncbi:hypothetical protein AB9P05_19725 [Roseivirga sp. BDSF3-8]|uniref:hypothetical protein n=1 Tax=Roseivirga sp. BDSF3-8 TaxID=3241598 RepID=UPI003531A53A